MRNITKIFILVFSLILLLAVSCSNDDKTGVKNNPPENDTEITDGETGSGGTGSGSGGSSETGTGGSGSGSETGGSGTGGSGTGGDSGTETGGGSGTGTGGDSGSGEGGGGGTETPPTPSEPETIEEIDAKDFPTDLLGTYRDENIASAGYGEAHFNTKVSYDETTKKTEIEGVWLFIKDDGKKSGQTHTPSIEKWKKTTKGGNPIKLEGESSDSGGGKYTVIYDYASGTLSGTYTHPDGTKASFNGKKIS